jgi:hypothetical protein
MATMHNYLLVFPLGILYCVPAIHGHVTGGCNVALKYSDLRLRYSLRP